MTIDLRTSRTFFPASCRKRSDFIPSPASPAQRAPRLSGRDWARKIELLYSRILFRFLFFFVEFPSQFFISVSFLELSATSVFLVHRRCDLVLKVDTWSRLLASYQLMCKLADIAERSSELECRLTVSA